LQRLRPVEHAQLAQRHLLDVWRQPARPLSPVDFLCLCVLKALYRACTV
jgi:hypothetical protein